MLTFLGFAQSPSYSPKKGHYYIQNFTNKDYNASPQNWSFTQSKQGQLVIGNVREVLLYNGKDWKNIEVNNSLSIRSLDCDEKGTIYVGTNNDIGKIVLGKKGKPIFISIADKIGEEREGIREVWKTFCTPNGVFFQSETKVFLIKEDKLIKKWDAKDPGFQFSFLLNNTLYIRHKSQGLMYINPQMQMVPVADNNLFKELVVSAILPYGKDSVLISTKDQGLFISSKRLSDLDIKPFKTEADELFKNYFIYRSILLTDGNYCFAIYNNGCLILKPNGEIVEHVNKENGILNDRVWNVFQDRDRNIWLGLDKGISKIEYGTGLTYYNEKDGFEGALSNIVCSKNNISISTSLGVYKKDDNQLFKKSLALTDQFWDVKNLNDKFNSIAYAGKSGLFIQNNIDEIVLQGDFRSIATKGNSFYTICNDMLYVVDVLENGKLNVKEKTLTIEDVAQSIAIDANGNIWAGLLDYGVRIIKNPLSNTTTIEQYDTTNGLPDIIANKPVLFQNKMFLLTVNGLYELNGNRFNRSELNKKWFGNDSIQIWSFYSDSKQRCWMEINRFYKNTDSKAEVGYLDLKTNNWVSGLFKRIPKTLVNSFTETVDGKILMATDEGIVIYDDSKKAIDKPIVNISFIKAGKDTLISYSYGNEDDKLIFNKALSLNTDIEYSSMPLLINYASPFFNAPEETMYSYLLEGETNTWSDWSKESKKEYNKLQPGTYTFWVKSKNVFEQESEAVSLTFTILPPWYLTWWAYLIYAILAVMMVYGIVQISVYRLKQAKIKLETIVTERTAEVVKQKDEILEQKEELEKQKLEIENFNQELSHKNKEITDSIQYAKKIQEAILVEEQTIYQKLPQCFILYKPRDIVSGDFYWFHEVENDVLIAAADCTGHGVPGAFMSMIGTTLLNEIVDEKKITSPQQILNQLHQEVRRSLKQDEEASQSRDGMDIALCRVNVANRSLKYAGAMRPLYIIRNTNEGPAFEEIKATKNPIGGKQTEDRREFVLNEFNFNQGDTVYFFSDGYADQFGGPDGKKFMTKKFQQLLISITASNMQEQKSLVDHAFESWRGNHEQVDDVLVIGIRF